VVPLEAAGAMADGDDGVGGGGAIGVSLRQWGAAGLRGGRGRRRRCGAAAGSHQCGDVRISPANFVVREKTTFFLGKRVKMPSMTTIKLVVQ